MDEIGRHVRKLNGAQGAHEVTDQFERPLVIKPTKRVGQFGVKETINEYIAGRLAEELSLNVPKHGIAQLSQDVIDTYPDLVGFEAGHVLAIEYIDGVDLAHASRFMPVADALIGLTEYTNRKTAIGVIVTDSWIMNTDRGLAGLKGEAIPMSAETPNKDDNLFLRQVTGADGAWDLYAIDFGYSFRKCTWGRNGNHQEWEDWLLGVIPTFFRSGLLKPTIEEHKDDVAYWIGEVAQLDLDETLGIILSEIPIAWHRQCNPKLGEQDYGDLQRRLDKSANTVESRLQKYNGVASRYVT